MEKDNNSKDSLVMIKLCEMPSCTFKAVTPDGVLTINVKQIGEEKTDPDYYDMFSTVVIKKEDDSILSSIIYRHLVNKKANRFELIFREEIKYNSDDLHPFGYSLVYSYEDFNNTRMYDRNRIIYENGNKNYEISKDKIKINEKEYIISLGSLFNILNNKFSIGINLTTGEETVYVNMPRGKIVGDILSIPIKGNFTDMLNDCNKTLQEASTEVTNSIVSKLKDKYSEESIRCLLKLSSLFELIPLPDKVDFEEELIGARLAVNPYLLNVPLLDQYHSQETLSAIDKAIDKYKEEQESHKEPKRKKRPIT